MMNFALSVVSLGQAEDDVMEYALMVRRHHDHTNRYIHIYPGQPYLLHKFVYNFLENITRSIVVSIQRQRGDNNTSFDAHDTVSEIQPVKTEIVIDEIEEEMDQQSEKIFVAFDPMMNFAWSVASLSQAENDVMEYALLVKRHGDYGNRYTHVFSEQPHLFHNFVFDFLKNITQSTLVSAQCQRGDNDMEAEVDSVGRVYECGVCGACYGRLSLLEKHMKSKHTVSKHRCHICSKYFFSTQNVNRHIASIHCGVKLFQCPTCDKKFSRKAVLKAHIKNIHEGQEFVCEKCGKIFNQKCNLKTHEMIHRGEKPYICEMCGKGFTQSSNLIEHRRRHLNIKPYQCPICDVKFVTNSELKSHVNCTHQCVNQ